MVDDTERAEILKEYFIEEKLVNRCRLTAQAKGKSLCFDISITKLDFVKLFCQNPDLSKASEPHKIIPKRSG